MRPNRGSGTRQTWSIMVLTIGGCLAAGIAHCDPTAELDDAATRLQYAFYTSDARHLQNVLGVLERLQVPAALAAMKEYYAAYGQWKLLQLHADDSALAGRDAATSRKAANAAANACVEHSEAAFKLQPAMAEAYAIHAVCSAFGTGLIPLGQPSFGACANSKSMRMARQLDATNPRVMLIEALCLGGGDAASSTASVDKLRETTRAFESAAPSQPGKPDWGQVEALAMLGQAYLQRGDTLAARDAIERALVLAPDYRKAQELLQPAATRPR